MEEIKGIVNQVMRSLQCAGNNENQKILSEGENKRYIGHNEQREFRKVSQQDWISEQA